MNIFWVGEMVTNDSLRRSAASLGLNLTKFDSEFYDRTHSKHIDEDIQSGKNSGVKGTPTFFINGEFYNGSWDLDKYYRTYYQSSLTTTFCTTDIKTVFAETNMTLWTLVYHLF